MKTKILIMIVVVGIVLGVGLLVASSLNKPNSSPQASTVPSRAGSTGGSSSTTSPIKTDVTIRYTDSGFQPDKVTIRAGQTIAFVNDSSRELQITSDQNPANSDNSELNVGYVSIGAIQTATLTAKGTQAIHNQFIPADRATIVVE